MNTETLAILAVIILTFGLISRRIENSIITPPMVFVTAGLLMSPQLLGWLHIEISQEFLRLLAELTLIIVLFTDASRIDLKLLRREYNLPLRLLGIGLPLTMIFGAIFAYFLFGGQLSFWEAAALSTILSPTDAALGQAVVSSPVVPVCIRQSLNVESGLNDGICLPILLIFISLAAATTGAEGAREWVNFSAKQVLLGPIVGAVAGYMGVRLVVESSKREGINESFKSLAALGLSLLAYSLAELVGGNGFIAAFSAGLIVGNSSNAKSICKCLHDFGETGGQLLVLLIFLIYGANTIVPAFAQWNWQIVVYAVSSLTIIRLLGVAISVIGMRLQRETVMFLGWFGPRGIASVLYGLLVIENNKVPGEPIIFSTMVLTVLLSVFAHGITAVPGANWYAKRLSKMGREMPEMIPVPEMPVRLPIHDK